MPWWKFWSDEEDEEGPRDHYRKGREFAEEGEYRQALTSFRLAFNEASDRAEKVKALEEMAMAYTQLKWFDEAIKTYRRALETDAESPGSHYGLAFCYKKRGQVEAACRHLEAFLDNPPDGPEADRHVRHARETLEELRGEDAGTGPGSSSPSAGDADRG